MQTQREPGPSSTHHPRRQSTWSGLRFTAVALAGTAAALGASVTPSAAAALVPGYSQSILADGPALYWRLDQPGSATARDLSRFARTGTLLGTASQGVPGALANDADTAARFDGINGSIQGTQLIRVGTGFTVEAWFKAATPTSAGPIVSIDDGKTARMLYLDSGRIIGMADLSANWPAYSVTSTTLDMTVWHHAAFTVRGTALTLYVDGQLAGKTQAPAGTAFNGRTYLAWSGAQWLPHLAADVDEVALYPTELSASHILTHYQTGAGKTPTPVPGAACNQTLQSLIDAAPSNSTVTAGACIYRETVNITRPVTLVGQVGTEIRGSDVWTNWTPGSDGLFRKGPLPALYAANDPKRCSTADLRCLAPEQVFFDGRPLQRVMGTSPTITAGQFFVDANRAAVLADNPTGHVVEVSTRPFWVTVNTSGVVVRNFTMRHAANDSNTGAISNTPGYSTIGYGNFTLADSILLDAHGSAVSIRDATNLQVLRNEIAGVGDTGLHGTGVTQGLVQGNHIHANGTDGFSLGWGEGGVKMTALNGVTFDSNEVDHNQGPGLWCDIGCQNVTYSANRVHHNSAAGIFWEISSGASIHDNVVWENGWSTPSWGWGAGILVSSAANAEIFNNTLAWNSAGITVISQNRPDAVTPAGNSVHDNTIVKKTVTGDFSQTYWQNLSLAWLSDGAPLYAAGLNNRGLNNHYSYDLAEQQSVRFAWTAQYLTLAEFQPTSGGSGGSYLSAADAHAALVAKNLPVASEAH